VTLRSAGLGKGSELIIRLPLAQPSSAESDALIQPSGRTPRSYRILLIEDNPMGARAMSLLLTRSGNDVRVARTGAEGISTARQFAPEVVLCDIGLPDMDGFAVARALRRELATAKAYLIALSGYGQPEYQRQALEAGFNIHVTKPVKMSVLSELFDRAAKNHEATL
jgi:two-component system CheB/CheR fusion protein